MGAITIRGLDDGTVRRWKQYAKANGRSMEAELRRVVEAGPGDSQAGVEGAAGVHDPEALRALEGERDSLLGPDGRFRPGPELVDHMRRWQRAMFGDRQLPDSTALIREMRYDDDPAAWSGE